MDIVVLFLGENVGRLEFATTEEGSGDRHFWARIGTVSHAYLAELCDLIPSNIEDLYSPPKLILTT